jgi:hypothetical protein
MAFTRSNTLRLLALSIILIVPMAAFAADNVGTPSGGGASIEWAVKARNYDHIELRVVDANGDAISSEFDAGVTPSFSVSDLGSGLKDGQYSYELRVVPNIPSSVQLNLQKARKANDDAAIRKILRDNGLDTPSVQSGFITVLNGQIVRPGQKEPTAHDDATSVKSVASDATLGARAARPINAPQALDTVIPDDLIVQSSTCTGFDCVNGESFGFDTLRLKENNLRIHFDDTSASAGYPANDWRIIANDSTSGGGNFLAIEDSTAGRNIFVAEAGTPANGIYLDSTGRVGFRQSAPGLDLHMTTGDTPAIRFEQTAASGFTAQTWDIGANEANFFVRDLTGGSRLSFRIRPGAPTSSIDIAASGNVGIGTASPEAKLHVFGTSTADTFGSFGEDPDGSTGTQSALTYGYSGASFGRASGFFNVRPDTNAVAPNPSLRLATANVVRVLIDNEGFIGLGDTASTGANPTSPIQYTNGTSTARLTLTGVWQDASSRKAKEHIESLSADDARKALDELTPVTYNYKTLPTDPKVGFIAEDVPDLVATPERDGLSALDIVAVVTKVVKEQQKTIDQLNERIAQLEQDKNQ